jgi:uncharacterized alpha-E superfamily protein
MLSRVADSAYWMSRYLERAEHAARLGDVCLSLSLDRPSDAVRRLLPTLGAPPAGYGVRARAAHPGSPHAAVVAAPIDAIVACVSAARENARQIREQISSEMWEQLNRLFLFVRQERRRRDSASTFDFFRAVKEGSHLFQGLTDATMTHGEGWHFIQIGRFLERAGATATLLDAHLGGASEHAAREIGTLVEWVGLLRSCAAFEAYCRCYTADIRPARVAEFLLLNAESPRSVRFAIDRVEVSLRAIARHSGKTAAGRVDRLAGRLQASLDFSQIDEILAGSLHQFVQDVRQQGDLVHSALFETYISYPTAAAIAS